MAHLTLRAEVPDFNTWKRAGALRPGPGGRARAAKGYRLYRRAENPNEVIVQVEFAPAEDAKAFRERLNASGVLNDPRAGKVPAPPIISEEAETVTYRRSEGLAGVIERLTPCD